MAVKRLIALVTVRSVLGEDYAPTQGSSWLQVQSTIRKRSHADDLPFVEVDGGFGIAFGSWRQPRPLQVETVRADGTTAWSTAPYTTVASGGLLGEGIVTTPGGARLAFVDAYAPDAGTGGSLIVTRKVEVLAVGTKASDGAAETGFSSQFSLALGQGLAEAGARGLRSKKRRPPGLELFMPGVAYAHSEEFLPPGALAGDPDAAHVLVREDRLPLPLVMLRDPDRNETGVLVRRHPDGASFTGENVSERLQDARMNFGSLGLINAGGAPELAYRMPGSEGDRTYVCSKASWANRSHPLEERFQHTYELRFSSEPGLSYVEAATLVWRDAFDEADPLPPPIDLDKAHRASINLLSTYGVRYHGVPSIPFKATVPEGIVTDKSSQMGFTGMAPTCAALLLDDALELGDDARRDQAEAVIDFWVFNSMNPSGMPRLWYDIHTNGQVTWRRKPKLGHIRSTSEGVRGILYAWHLLKKDAWLAYARRFGDFLVKRQFENGSFAGVWNWNGTAFKHLKSVANHAVPFLAELFWATGHEAYRDAAKRAGEYTLATTSASFVYAGGIDTRPGRLDKEAGVLAMKAFIALYDLTEDTKWVAAAVDAATFSETWTYAWHVPIPIDDPHAVYPKARTSLGASLIGAGFSGADNFMAAAVFDYYRLYLLTWDQHFLRFSRFLSAATKQIMDWDGTLGYAHPGLMTEATTFAVNRGHGVRYWLPWLTAVVLDPMMRLRRAFGTWNIDLIEELPMEERLRRASRRPPSTRAE